MSENHHDEIKRPVQRLLRLPAVCDRTGLSQSGVWRAVREWRFPAPVRIGQQAVAWHEAAVDEWIASRPLAMPRARAAKLAKAGAA